MGSSYLPMWLKLRYAATVSPLGCDFRFGKSCYTEMDISVMRSDKKNASDRICFMIPKTVGNIVEFYKTTEELLMLKL